MSKSIIRGPNCIALDVGLTSLPNLPSTCFNVRINSRGVNVVEISMACSRLPMEDDDDETEDNDDDDDA